MAAGFALGGAAQTRNPVPAPPPDRSIVTAEAPRAPGGENTNAEDVEFLTEALRTSLAEVQLGELAADSPLLTGSALRRVRDYYDLAFP